MDHKMLAIVEALQHCQQYLHGKKLIICMDYRPLTNFFTQPNLPPSGTTLS